ncbi:hypothetical protein [Pseudomonas sp. AK106]
MADITEAPPASLTQAAPEKRKPGRPSTGQALSRATIQRQYRQRINSNVTKNTVESLDENMALRAQVLQLMNELEDAQMKARVEFELGEKARARVRELERRLAGAQPAGTKKASSEARYELQARSDFDGEWFRMGSEWTYKTKSVALADLKRTTEGKDDSPYRILDRKTGKILTA